MLNLLVGCGLARSKFGLLSLNKLSFGHNLLKNVIRDTKEHFRSNFGTKTSPVVVYSFESKNLYRMMSVFGIIQSVFWLNLASLSLIPIKETDGDVPYLLEFQKKHRYKIAVGSCLLGGLVLFFTIVFPLRSISRITVQRGLDVIDISTYSFFGKQRVIKTSLDNVSCSLSRNANGSHLSMKIKGKPLYFLLDKNKGIFHEPKLFDHVVGLKRNLN